MRNAPSAPVEPFDPDLLSRAARLLRSARVALLLLFVASLVQHSCVSSYIVSGNSMQPTFADGDRVVVARMPPMFLRPERGDTVIARVGGEILIKRVIGCPGEEIAIGHGQVLCDGEVATDPTPPHFRKMDDMAAIRLADDQYFLLGDHRRVSIDSRDFGPVHRHEILGRVIYRVPATAVVSASTGQR